MLAQRAARALGLPWKVVKWEVPPG
jgi:hypothetical protein